MNWSPGNVAEQPGSWEKATAPNTLANSQSHRVPRA
ncbi:hypothetical protein LMG24076_03375 [Trinickia soli]|nr:hypothetical protein LMG24076_03375 [Trinickia soli]